MSISRAKRQQINLPSGNNTEIQYNDNGAFGGSSNLTFDGTTLNVTGDLSVAGNYTNSAQPAFNANMSADANNVTGDGTPFTLTYDTERFDQGADFNTSTYTFTAPVTGRYQFNMLALLMNIGASHTYGNIWLITSNKTYYNQVTIDNIGAGNKTLDYSVLTDMDAADTAYVQITAYGSTATVAVNGTNPGTNFFTGHLVC